jgi:hypothetical protein
VAPLVGLAGEDSARPMALVMLCCSLLGIGALALARPFQRTTAAGYPAAAGTGMDSSTPGAR